MNNSQKNNITQFKGYVTRNDREKRQGHKGAVIWFTGLSASGKSTLAHHLEKRLYDMGYMTYVFDGDNVRHGLCCDLDFSDAGRSENVRRIGEMTKLFLDAGIMAIAAFIAPSKTDREKIKKLIGEKRFIEVFVDCPLNVCIMRDPKGLYKKALAGGINDFTGVSGKYDPPATPHITIKSHEEEVGSAVSRLIDLMEERGLIKKKTHLDNNPVIQNTV